jgi:glycerol kinase
MVKNTYGAGAFMIMNTGEQPVVSNNRLVTTIAYQVEDQPVYALEGSIFSAGTAIQWLHDRLDMIDTQLDAWMLAEDSKNHNEVYVVPAFNGLGAPYWDPHVQGTVFGMTRGTNKADFVKATLQSIAYQTADILDIMKKDSGYTLATMKADGSVSRNPYLMQFQADIAHVAIERSLDEDATPMGAAFLAGLAVGYWRDLSDLEQYVQAGRHFEPQLPKEQRQRLHKGWQSAIKATQYFGEI